MKSQRQHMLDGDPYSFTRDAELRQGMKLCRERLQRFNATGEGLDELIPSHGERVELVAPFACDYGVNITLGSDVFINSGCKFLDCGRITIGNFVLVGPDVKLCAASHPMHYIDRRDWEIAKPIVLEDDVWLGAGVIVCQGVTVGARSIAAAGSVITRDVPPDSLVAGNPAEVKKRLNVDAPLGSRWSL